MLSKKHPSCRAAAAALVIAAATLSSCSDTTSTAAPSSAVQTSTSVASLPAVTDGGGSTAPPPTEESVPDAPGAATATPAAAERMLQHAVTTEAQPCPEPFDATTDCGLATVPADWAAPSAGTMQIWYAHVPAPAGKATGLSIPFLGGPGEAISASAGLFLPMMEAMPDRDMLFVDVRGNGLSGQLTCPLLDTMRYIPQGDEQLRAAECGEQIGPARNHYTTVASVLDVEAIRRALDLADPSLMGFSYGTYVAQTYTVLFPDQVRATVLDGVMPLDLDPLGTSYTDGFQRVLPLRCERTGWCDADTIGTRVQDLARRLAADPVPFDDGTGRSFTEGTLAYLTLFAVQGDLGGYLAALDAADGGDLLPFIELAIAAMAAPAEATGSFALSPVVQCNDYTAAFDLAETPDVRRAQLAAVLDALDDDVFGWFSKDGWMSSAWEQGDFCLDWPTPEFVAELRVPLHGPFDTTPVLMLNGDIDLQTPLEGVARAVPNWPNATLVVIEDAAHPTIPVSECALALALAFIEDPAVPPAESCDGEPVTPTGV